MVATRSSTLGKTPLRMALSVSSRNHRSTRLSYEDDMGVKCRWNRRCLSNQALTLGWLWVP